MAATRSGGSVFTPAALFVFYVGYLNSFGNLDLRPLQERTVILILTERLECSKVVPVRESLWIWREPDLRNPSQKYSLASLTAARRARDDMLGRGFRATLSGIQKVPDS